MLLVSIPRGKPEGTCRINGEQVEYRIDNGILAIRHGDNSSWDVRRILDVADGGDGHAVFVCSDAEDCGADFEPQIIPVQDLVPLAESDPEASRPSPPIKLSHLPLRKDLVADAVHNAVSEYTGTDGCGRCMYYAIAGSSLLSQLTGRLHVPQVGSLHFLAALPDYWIEMDIQHWGDSLTSMELGEFHAWIATTNTLPNSGKCTDATCIDLTTRHFKKLAEKTESGESLIWNRPDPPKYLWSEIKDLPDWIRLKPDEAATKAAWDAFATTCDQWSSLLTLARSNYECFLDRDHDRAVRSANRKRRKAERQRRRSSRH